MHPLLWLASAFLTIAVLFVAAAVVYTVVEKFRELPPKRRTHRELDPPNLAPRITYSETNDRVRHGSKRSIRQRTPPPPTPRPRPR